MIVFFIGIIVIFLSLFVFYLKSSNILRTLYLSKQFPGPPALPFVGNASLFAFKSKTDNFKACCKLVNDYGDVSRMWDATQLVILFSNPEDIEAVLCNPTFLQKAKIYKYLTPWLNEGLLLSHGKKWATRRKTLTPAFHFKILEGFVEIMDQNCGILVDEMAKLFNKSSDKVELFKLLSLCSLDIICESSMGISIHAMKCKDSEYIKAVKCMTELIHDRMFSILMRYDIVFRFMSKYYEQKRMLKILHGFTDKVIFDRRNEIEKNNYRNISDSLSTESEYIGAKKKMVFLDILLQSTINGEPLSNLDIREEVDTFMFEGHDTITTGLIFLLYNVAKYPNVQKKCFEEIRKIIGDDPTVPVTMKILNDLHYLELVIKESLRLFPPVTSYGRSVDDEVEINGKIIPAGTILIVVPYMVQRSQRLFENADKFIPERFEKIKHHPFAYIPFSAGSRNCIGQKFAMLELKCILMKVLRYYELSLDADSLKEPELTAEIVTAPFNKIHFHLKPREY